MEKTKFYVYRHIRLDTNTPFYVGKGSNRRARKRGRNIYWDRIVKKANYKIEILKYFNDEEEAYDFERTLISLYKSLGYCEANLAAGGLGGPNGLSAWNKGLTGKKSHVYGENNGRFNKPVPQSTRDLISKANKNKPCKVKDELSIKVKNYWKQYGQRDYKERAQRSRSMGNRPFKVFKDEKLIGIWEIQRECAKDLNLTHQNIGKALRQNIIYKGYIFKWI